MRWVAGGDHPDWGPDSCWPWGGTPTPRITATWVTAPTGTGKTTGLLGAARDRRIYYATFRRANLTHLAGIHGIRIGGDPTRTPRSGIHLDTLAGLRRLIAGPGWAALPGEWDLIIDEWHELWTESGYTGSLMPDIRARLEALPPRIRLTMVSATPVTAYGGGSWSIPTGITWRVSRTPVSPHDLGREIADWVGPGGPGVWVRVDSAIAITRAAARIGPVNIITSPSNPLRPVTVADPRATLMTSYADSGITLSTGGIHRVLIVTGHYDPKVVTQVIGRYRRARVAATVWVTDPRDPRYAAAHTVGREIARAGLIRSLVGPASRISARTRSPVIVDTPAGYIPIDGRYDTTHAAYAGAEAGREWVSRPPMSPITLTPDGGFAETARLAHRRTIDRIRGDAEMTTRDLRGLIMDQSIIAYTLLYADDEPVRQAIATNVTTPGEAYRLAHRILGADHEFMNKLWRKYHKKFSFRIWRDQNLRVPIKRFEKIVLSLFIELITGPSDLCPVTIAKRMGICKTVYIKHLEFIKSLRIRENNNKKALETVYQFLNSKGIVKRTEKIRAELEFEHFLTTSLNKKITYLPATNKFIKNDKIFFAILLIKENLLTKDKVLGFSRNKPISFAEITEKIESLTDFFFKTKQILNSHIKMGEISVKNIWTKILKNFTKFHRFKKAKETYYVIERIGFYKKNPGFFIGVPLKKLSNPPFFLESDVYDDYTFQFYQILDEKIVIVIFPPP